MAFDIEKVRGIAERVAESSGLEVVDLEMQGGGPARMLRVFIDKPEGVTHEDCSQFSREFGTILDVEDAIPGAAYTLEISSPGLDRRLIKAKDYERFKGSLVKLTTFEAVGGDRHFQGRLESFENGRLSLDLSAGKKRKKGQALVDARIEIDLANIEKANLVPEI
ncbi:MAG TPA: ribosome maturation factor RimP [Clostridia bacterium]|nr:ribosome maturation factor RimP [Clostridia bacterium]